MLAWFKFQAKIPSRSGVCVQGEWQKYTPPSPPLSKDEGLKNIGHSMSIRNLIFGVNSVTVSYLIHYDSLLQNATDIITKCSSYFIIRSTEFYYKMRQVFYYKTRQFYYKMWQLLQNETFITNCNRTEEYQLIEIHIQAKFHFFQYKLKFNLNSTFWLLFLCTAEAPIHSLIGKILFLNYPLLNPVYTSGCLILYLR